METMERAGRLVRKMKVSAGITDPGTRARRRAMAAAKNRQRTRLTNWCAGLLVVEVEDFVGKSSQHSAPFPAANRIKNWENR
jgi:hypothetical protein